MVQEKGIPIRFDQFLNNADNNNIMKGMLLVFKSHQLPIVFSIITNKNYNILYVNKDVKKIIHDLWFSFELLEN